MTTKNEFDILCYVAAPRKKIIPLTAEVGRVLD